MNEGSEFAEKIVTFALESTERTPYVVDDVTQQPIHLQLLSLCEDSRGDKWMGVSIYFDYHSLKQLGFDFGQLGDETFDREHELMQDTAYMYVPLSRIQGFCYTIDATRTDFLNRKKNDELPRRMQPKLIKFSRYPPKNDRRRVRGLLLSREPIHQPANPPTHQPTNPPTHQPTTSDFVSTRARRSCWVLG